MPPACYDVHDDLFRCGRLFGFGGGLQQVGEVEVARLVARDEQLRPGDTDLVEGQGQPEDRAELEVGKHFADSGSRFGFGVVEFESVDPQAQHERVDIDILDTQLGAEIVAHGVLQGFFQQVRGEHKTQQCVQQDCAYCGRVARVFFDDVDRCVDDSSSL